MKIINSAVVLLSTFAVASARLLKAKTDHVAEEHAVATEPEMQSNLAPASRQLWRASSYIQHCGCVDDFIKELGNVQYEALSNVNTISSLGFLGSGTPLYGNVIDDIMSTAQEGIDLLDTSYKCGCNPNPHMNAVSGAGPPFSPINDQDPTTTHYQMCCCDAGKVKDIYVHSLQALADIPNEHFIIGSLDTLIAAITFSDGELAQTVPLWDGGSTGP